MGKKTIVIALITLIILAAAGVAVFAGFGSVTATLLAEAYVYEQDNLLLTAKVIPDQNHVKVELVETNVVTEDGIPAINSQTHVFNGSLDRENLSVTLELGQTVKGTVNENELVFLSPVMEGFKGQMKFQAITAADAKQKLDTLTARVTEEAEQKKKERQAMAEAQAELAKKVERTTRIQADIEENAKFLADSHFSEESAAYKEQVAELQRLLDQIAAYAAQPGLQKTEYDVMVEMAGSMKILLDGLAVIDGNVEPKKKNVADIMAIMEADLADVEKSWEEIKEDVPERAARLKAYNAAKQTGSQALAKAKKSVAAIEAQKLEAKKKAAQLYQRAKELLAQTKANHHF